MKISRKNKEVAIKYFSKYFSTYISYSLSIFYRIDFLSKKTKRISRLLKSIRYYDNNYSAISYLAKEKNCDNFFEKLDVSKGNSFPSKRVIVLAEKNSKEKKGVILVKFSDSFSKILNNEKFESINKNYVFILEPSWTGYADPDILAFCEKAEHLLIQASYEGDRALLHTLYPEIPVIDAGSSNWVNYEKFKPTEKITKDIDLLYIANNNPIKRVYKLIDVVKFISKKVNIKCKIICAGWGGSSNEIIRYIEEKRLGNSIEISDGLEREELIHEINRAKVSVLFSHKEGSNRVLFESLFCNTPIFCIKENKGVNKSYINEKTGMFAYEDDSAAPLMYMIKNYTKFSPREWALENITPEITTERIEKTIKMKYPEITINKLKIKINDPELKYKNEEELSLPHNVEDLVKHL